MVQLTFDHFQVIGNLLQDGKAGQNHAEGAAQAWPWAAQWLVPLAALQGKEVVFIVCMHVSTP